MDLEPPEDNLFEPAPFEEEFEDTLFGDGPDDETLGGDFPIFLDREAVSSFSSRCDTSSQAR